MNNYILTLIGLLTISYTTLFCMDKPQLIQRMKKQAETHSSQTEPGQEEKEVTCCMGLTVMFHDFTSRDMTWNDIFAKCNRVSKRFADDHVVF